LGDMMKSRGRAKTLTCHAYPDYTFSIESKLWRRLKHQTDEPFVMMTVHIRRGKDPRSLIEMVVGETLSFEGVGLLCTVLSVDFAYSGRTARITARILFLDT